MTELEIIKNLASSIDDRKYPFQIPNAFIYNWESDYWVLSATGDTKEFEIKCTRADYFNDAKKVKHKDCNGANYFYYVCPIGLIGKEEVDKRYGLIYISTDGDITIVKKPRRLNDNEFTQWKMLANKMYWRWRNLWRQKYIDKEITYDEYAAGFNADLEKEESNVDLQNVV